MTIDQDDPIRGEPEKKKWVEIPVLRGFDEDVEMIWNIAQECGAWVVGGYVRYMCSPLTGPDEEPRKNPRIIADAGFGHLEKQVPLAPAMDLDLFPKAEANYMDLTRELFQSGLVQTYENDICATFRWEDDPDNEKIKVQVIKPNKEGHIVTWGTMEEILDGFDFTVVRIGLLSPETALADVDFLEHEKIHKLVIKNIVCPISSVTRIAKYARKGYYIGIAQVVKLFVEWDERGWEYKQKIMDLLNKQEENGELTQDEIDLVEKLLRID